MDGFVSVRLEISRDVTGLETIRHVYLYSETQEQLIRARGKTVGATKRLHERLQRRLSHVVLNFRTTFCRADFFPRAPINCLWVSEYGSVLSSLIG